jgi:hypothetical protein
MQLAWPGQDLALAGLVVGYLAGAFAAVALCANRAASPMTRSTQ